MSESCLLVQPTRREKGMRADSGMGVNSRDALDVVRNVAEQDGAATGSTSINPEPSSAPRALSSDGNLHGLGSSSTPIEENEDLGQTSNMDDASGSGKLRRTTATLQGSGLVIQQERASVDGPSGRDEDDDPNIPQHERIQTKEPWDISYRSTPASERVRDILVSRLARSAASGRIQVIDLSRRGLDGNSAELIRTVLRQNPQLAVLKLGSNNLGDKGASVIASCSSKEWRHHPGLAVLDLGFNNIGDTGCTNLSLQMIAGNHTLRNLYLAGNSFGQKGTMAIASAILHGCGLSRLQLSANDLGATGVSILAGAVAEMDARRQQVLHGQMGIAVAPAAPLAIGELHLGEMVMTTEAVVALSGALVSNCSLQILGLSNNNLDDNAMALLSQALSQNKALPLSAVYLSFNKITCTGIECFMNAIWGSQTMKEVKLDNNKMQDRGAQLCSVVLGSVGLELLDIGFNRVTTVGIKAMMKTLSEIDSLRSLSLSGIPLDQNASKAVCYALAYNQSLEKLHLDSCSVGYSGQRHIAAGIVTNRNVKLRAVTGFHLQPITKTLGLPQVPEDWGNDRVLSFVRFMWSFWNSQLKVGDANVAERGPVAPALVASSAKAAFAALANSDEQKMQFQEEHATAGDESPLGSPGDAILVRSPSGQDLQIPAWDDGLDVELENESWSGSDSFEGSAYSGSGTSRNNLTSANPERRNRNLLWLQAHSHALNEVRNLAFNNADLWQLHQYFFSPAYTMTDEPELEVSTQQGDVLDRDEESSTGTSPSAISPSDGLTQAVSERRPPTIAKPNFKKLNRTVSAPMEGGTKRSNKRGYLEESLREAEPRAKRAKNLKPRIAYYPRIRQKLESLGKKPSAQTLSLLRQLKYIEGVLLQGKNVYVEGQEDDGHGPTTLDVEMILLDLL